jgi:hypothetical protein
MWIGWLEFVPQRADEPVLHTGRETTQATREALIYWATGLNVLYLEGAFARAARGFDHRRVVELVREHPVHVIDTDGTSYVARIYAAEMETGGWMGWIEFHARAAKKPTRYTDRETSQPTRDMVAYWAGGLQSVYLEGAFIRATRPRSPVAEPAIR